MEWQTQLTLIGVITILAVISPGPDFAITVKNSVAYGRSSGLATAAGIASGISIHVIYTLLGLGYILAEAIWLLDVMRYLGAAYLIWLGITAFKTESSDQADIKAPPQRIKKPIRTAFRSGAICNALNPKTALFFIALFSQVVHPSTPYIVQTGLGVFIAGVHFLWFAIVALLLTSKRFENIMHRAKSLIERLVGLCLIGLGAKLALSN